MKMYLPRARATELLREMGVLIGEDGLVNLAHRGRGPRYAIIHGRAVYTREDLVAWVSEQASRPPPRRPRRATAEPLPTAAAS